MIEIDRIITDVARDSGRRYFGKYRGLVVDNNDPDGLGRLKVQVPSVLSDQVTTGWAMPCVPYGGDANLGMLFIPEVGAGVWVEFEEGDLEFPIWVGTYWSKPGGTAEPPTPIDATGAEQSAQSPPTAKIIKTKAGHTIQLEDASGRELLVIKEGGKGSVVAMTQDGISIKDGANGHEVILDNQGIKVTDGVNQHTVTLSASKASVEAQWGSTVELGPAGITIDAGSAIVTVKGTMIKLGDSAALPILRVTDQGIGNLGAPVVMTGPGSMVAFG